MIRRILIIAFALVFTIFVAPAYAANDVAKDSAPDKFLDIQAVSSPGGLHAWLVEDHSLPIIAIKFSFKGAGSAQESADKQGLTLLLASTLDEGAGAYDSQAFQKALTDHSIALHFGSDRDNFNGSLKTLSRHKDKAYELLELALSDPRFDQEAIDRMRASRLNSLRTSMTDPDWIAARIMYDVSFPGHPYALNRGGTLGTLPAITAEDLRAFKETQLSQDRLYVAAVGDISAEELAALLDRLFGALPKTTGGVQDIADTTIKGGGKTFLFDKDIPQTIIEIQQPGINRHDPDYFAAQVMNFILGGSGFGSRLMEEVREKRGLSYGIYSGFGFMDHADSLSVTTSTRNETASEVLEIVKQEWERMRNEPVSEKELADAKSYLIGAMPLSLSSTDKIAALMLDLMLDDMPIDYMDTRKDKLNSVSVDDVQRVAKKILKPDNLTTVLVGRPENVTATQTIETLPNVE